MNYSDPNLYDYLRNLPSGYLLDLLADGERIDEQPVLKVLQERGLTLDDIELAVDRRRHARFPRGHILWTAARWASLGNTLIIGIFEMIGFYRLMHDDHAFKAVMIFLIVACTGFGFFLGYKFSTQVYQGSPSKLFCGFPVPVATIDLETGEERVAGQMLMIIQIGINAVVGVVFTIFPLMIIQWFLS